MATTSAAASSDAKKADVITGQRLGTPELLFECARQMGLRPSWVTPNGLFVIRVNGEEEYVNFARSPLNSDTNTSLARDKYLTRLILARHNMANIPFGRPGSHAEATMFLRRHKKIIAKPVNGSGARDIHIVTDDSQLQDLKIADYILEKYIPGKEIRYLVLNGTVVGVYQSEYGTSVDVKRPLQCVSYPRPAWNPALVSSSVKAAGILGLKFAAVDYLLHATEGAYILEVNTTPDLRWFHAPTSGPAVDVARLFLETITKNHEPKAAPAVKNTLGASPIMAYN